MMGHREVAVLDGGLPAWKEAGLDCEAFAQKQEFPKGDFVANFQKGNIKNAEEILQNIAEKSALVLDARSSGRFMGTAPEPRANLRGGHIPNSKSLPFTEVLSEGKFLPKEKIRTIFEKLNPNNQALIFTCGSGLTACITLLANELVADNEKSVYDGSWSEWGAGEEYPVVNKIRD